MDVDEAVNVGREGVEVECTRSFVEEGGGRDTKEEEEEVEGVVGS